MSSEYIPFEIQEEILKRLPVEPLLRFRSVSKSYKRLIDSPVFIVSYGIHHPPDDRFILKYEIEVEDNYLSLVDNENVNSLVQQEFIPTVPDLISRLSVVGSSHGLLCFDGYRDYILLWNPSIRKSVVILMPFMYDNKYFDGFTGFGVCPVTFDPTILIIQYEGKMKDTPGMRGAVFTLSTRTWSVLSTNNLYRESIRLCTGSDQVVIDRFIYWTAYDYMVEEDGRSQSPFLIMSFDLIAKEFKEINLTGSLTNRRCSIESISKLRESLVLLEYHRDYETDLEVCCLWMMKEQGVSRSFTKLYTINLLPDVEIICLLGFRKTGELLMEMELQSAPYNDVSIYDPNSKAVDNLGIGGDRNSFFMCSYMETLLLLDQLDGFRYSIDNQSQIIERLSLVKVE